MSTEKQYLTHQERTAEEPRSTERHTVILRKIDQINPRIKLFKFEVEDPEQSIKFQAGQWLDVTCPGEARVGGFTITSTPRDAAAHPGRRGRGTGTPFVELAVQRSPDNAPAAWLWRPEREILGQALSIQVGGSFVWPPPSDDGVLSAKTTTEGLCRAVFIAGGVGINPLISMLAHLHETDSMPPDTRFLYGTKIEAPSSPSASALSEVLFLPRLATIAQAHPGRIKLEVYGTGTSGAETSPTSATAVGAMTETAWPADEKAWALSTPTPLSSVEAAFASKEGPIEFFSRRMDSEDVLRALGPTEERKAMVCYICGPAGMTDVLSDFVRAQDGVLAQRVLCEKWW